MQQFRTQGCVRGQSGNWLSLIWLWRLKNVNVLLQLRGGWMKPKSKSRENGFTYIEPLINSATPLISCFPNIEMKRRPQLSSNKPSTLTGFLKSRHG